MNELDYLNFFIQYMISLISNNINLEENTKPIEVPVRPIMVKLPCPKCKIGFLEATSSVLTPFSEEAIVFHTCDSCNFSDGIIGQTYPYIKYVELENNI